MLPNALLAVIEPSKLKDYLLSGNHPVGRFKAAVFFSMGYTQENWTRLRNDLLQIAASGTVTLGEKNQYGQKYIVSGSLQGPNGRIGRFRTVWLLEDASSRPKFITAYPAE